MTIVYRILGFIINSIAILLAVSIVVSIPMILSSPFPLISAFIIVSIILYSFFSNKFHKQVLQKREIVKKSLKDWIRVNGIVSIIFSVIIFIDVAFLMNNPTLYLDAIEGYGVEMRVENINAVFIAILIYGAALLTHVLWTFALMKKNEEFFQ